MEHRDDSEDINEWQEIEHYPSLGWNMVQINGNYLGFHSHRSSSIEESPTVVPPATMDPQDGTSSPSAAPLSFESDEERATEMTAAPPSCWRLGMANEGRKLLKLRLEALRNRVVWVVSKVRNCAVCAGTLWSITCVAGASAAAALLFVVVYVGIQRRRRRRVDRQVQSTEQLVHLLREKDEKISQLIVQIVQLNEALSLRRKVPVLRISG